METALTRPQEMQNLFAELWSASTPPQVSMAACLAQLAASLDQPVSEAMAKGYLAVLSRLTRDEAVQAFGRAMESCKYFPRPSELLDLAGRAPAGDPLRNAAMLALRAVLDVIRTFGSELRPRGGKFVDRDKDGELLHTAYHEPSTPAPTLPAEIEAALEELGYGDRVAGLRALATLTERAEGPWQVAENRKLEQRWFEAYARAQV